MQTWNLLQLRRQSSFVFRKTDSHIHLQDEIYISARCEYHNSPQLNTRSKWRKKAKSKRLTTYKCDTLAGRLIIAIDNFFILGIRKITYRNNYKIYQCPYSTPAASNELKYSGTRFPT